MEIDSYEAMQLVKKQMEDQGCLGDSLEHIKSMQPHLYEWIIFFDLKEEFDI